MPNYRPICAAENARRGVRAYSSPSDSRSVPCVVLALLSAQLKFSSHTLRRILSRTFTCSRISPVNLGWDIVDED